MLIVIRSLLISEGRHILGKLLSESRGAVELAGMRLPTYTTAIDTLPDHHLGESFIDLCDLCLNFSHCLDGQNVSHIAEPQLRHVYQRLCVDAQAEFDRHHAVVLLCPRFKLILNDSNEALGDVLLSFEDVAEQVGQLVIDRLDRYIKRNVIATVIPAAQLEWYDTDMVPDEMSSDKEGHIYKLNPEQLRPGRRVFRLVDGEKRLMRLAVKSHLASSTH